MLERKFAATIAGAIIALTIAGRFLPDAMVGGLNITVRNQPMSWAHPLGTDLLGREQLPRLVACISISLVEAALGAVVALILSWPLAALIRIAPRWLRRCITAVPYVLFVAPNLLFQPLWSSRVLMTFCLMGGIIPAMIVLMYLIAYLGLFHGVGILLGIMFAFGVAYRLTHAPSYNEVGASHAERRTADFRQLMILGTSLLVWIIFVQAHLAMLDLGAQPPLPSWGEFLRPTAGGGLVSAGLIAGYVSLCLLASSLFFLGDVLGRREVLRPERATD